MAAPQTNDQGFNRQFSGDSDKKPKRPIGVTNPANQNKPPLRVITSSDRSDLQTQPSSVRNVRTSTMPGASANQSFESSKRDIATEFNASYAKQGIQPSSLDDEPVRKKYQQPDQLTRGTRVSYANVNPMPQKSLAQKATSAAGTIRNELNTATKRAKATQTNLWAGSWGIWVWFWMQLPLAILSIAFLAITSYLSDLHDSLLYQNPTGIIQQAYNDVAQASIDIAGYVGKLALGVFGFDINVISPSSLFSSTYLLVFLFGLLNLFVLWAIYTFSNIKCLSGEAIGLKMGMLLLCIIGYSLPLFNLFPWFICWAIVVWLYPK